MRAEGFASVMEFGESSRAGALVGVCGRGPTGWRGVRYGWFKGVIVVDRAAPGQKFIILCFRLRIVLGGGFLRLRFEAGLGRIGGVE